MSELYKKYRPKTLKGIVGNKETVQTLSNMLERETVPHTILFTGPSGCGKTTLARILKNQLDCADIDFQELNCSDFRGIDTVRDIARSVNMAPTGGSCRIWLLDEVHQMSKDGQNAALKLLEDTPKHVYFFLCTTDPQKIIKTIRTRCCEMPVELLRDRDAKRLVGRILKREEMAMKDDIIEDLIDAAAGSARQLLVILDKVLNLPENQQSNAIKAEDVAKECIDLCRALIKCESWNKIAKILKELSGDPESIRYAVLGYARTCLLGGNPQAARVIESFADNFYDSKAAGLALACYESVSDI